MEEERSVINEFDDLYEQRERLLEQRNEASEITRDLYDSAIEAADNKLTELAQTPEAQKELEQLRRSVGAIALGAFRELNELELSAGHLIGSDEIQKRRQEVEKELGDKPEYLRMKRLQKFAGSVATGSQVEEEAVQSVPETEITVQPKPVAPYSTEAGTSGQQYESEPTKPHVTVTIREDGNVQVGRRVVELGQHREHMHDYSEDRIKIAQTLIEHQGEELSVYDLWEKTFSEEGRQFNARTMMQVKTWLENHFTYKKHPIAVHNGKRGSRSAYIIKDFDVEFYDKRQSEGKYVLPNGAELKGSKATIARALMENLEDSEYMSSDALKLILYGDTTDRSTQRLSAGISQMRRLLRAQGYRLSTIHEEARRNSKAYYRIDPITEPEESVETETKPASNEYASEHAEILHKIDLPAATKLAACLEKRREYLAALNVQVPPEGMANAFIAYADAHGVDLHQQESDMETLRQQALEALAYIKENDDVLEEALDVLPRNHPTLDLVGYILDCGDHVEEIQSVVKGEPRHEYTEQKGKRIEIGYRGSELILPDGRVVKPENPEIGSEEPSLQNNDIVQTGTEEETEDYGGAESVVKPSSGEITVESVIDEHVYSDEAYTKKQERELELEQGIQDTIEETLQTIHQAGMLDGGTLHQVQSVYSFVTTRFFKSAQENGIVKGKDEKITPEEIIKLKLLGEYGPNTYATKQFKKILKRHLRGAPEHFKEEYGIE